jgi:RNA polymerase sigma-70 factor (ECF subfamily)
MSASTTPRLPDQADCSEAEPEPPSSCLPLDFNLEANQGARRPSPAVADGPAPASDEDLLGRYRDDRRPEDLAELFRRYSGELSRYLASYLGDDALTEDVVQDTFLQVHVKCGLYRDGWPARPWLYAVALHRAIDARRQAKRMPSIRIEAPIPADESPPLLDVLASEAPGPLDGIQVGERQDWIRASVARLPDAQRQVLLRTYYQGMTYAEVANLMKIPEGTVKSRLHGAIARMRAMADRSGCP